MAAIQLKYPDKRGPGQPPKFTPETLLKAANAYFVWADENPICEQKLMMSQGLPVKEEMEHVRPLSLRAFYTHAGLAETTWYEYKANPKYTRVCYDIDNHMTAQRIDGASVGMYNSNIISRVLGLAEITKTDVQAVVVAREMTEKEFAEKIDGLSINRRSSQLNERST